MKRIAFVVQLPKYISPGQRFRFEQYEPFLEKEGFIIDTYPFFDEKTRSILYKKGHLFRKVIGVCKGFWRRVAFIGKVRNYDYIFLQREMTPIGPPILEWITAKLLRVKIVYDFDDAIWVPNITEGNMLVASIKCYWKIKHICRWAHKVSVGNDFLANFARKYNRNVVYNPTCVDTDERYNIREKQRNDLPVIGWTGSHSTLQFLKVLYPILKRLEESQKFTLLVICDQKPDMDLKSLNFTRWNKETEIEDLARIDIGIMPLKDDAWSEGKCGFKIIQYLALGIPSVASPVGVNKKIIDHGSNGYLCTSEAEWLQYLSELLNDREKRIRFGHKGREKIKEAYSVTSNKGTILSLFSN